MRVEPGDAVGLTCTLAYSPDVRALPLGGGSNPDWLETVSRRDTPFGKDGCIVFVHSVISGPDAEVSGFDPNPTVGFIASDGVQGWTTQSRLSGNRLTTR